MGDSFWPRQNPTICPSSCFLVLRAGSKSVVHVKLPTTLTSLSPASIRVYYNGVRTKESCFAFARAVYRVPVISM